MRFGGEVMLGKGNLKVKLSVTSHLQYTEGHIHAVIQSLNAMNFIVVELVICFAKTSDLV